jgi:tripartite-type tricarboxylate transporter receptor subunit TctC
MTNRRDALRGLVAAGLAGALPTRAWADRGEIRFVCGYPAGSGADAIVRFMAEHLRLRFEAPVIVENRPGAFTNIAADYVMRAKPDGRTIFVNGGSTVPANMYLLANPTVDPRTAFRMVATLNRQPTMIAVSTSRPWRTLAELTAALKEKGAAASYGTTFSTAKAVAGVYKQSAGVPDAVEINYKTSNDTRTDLLRGALDFVVTDPVFAMREEGAGTIRILGITSAERLKARPDLPTVREQGVPIDLTGWWGVMVPAATPHAFVVELNGWVNAVVESDDAKRFFNNFGADPWATSADEAQAAMLKEIDIWAEIARTVPVEKMG